MLPRLAASTLFLSALALAVMLGQPAAQAEQLSGKPLVDALADGGYVIYIRHTATEKNQKDTDVSDLSNCATQRNLSDEGRAQAKQMGEGLARHGIKVEKVYSSPYCRAVETAKLAFGDYEAAPSLRYLTRLTKDEAAAATAWLRAELAKAPAAGVNVVLISHTANLKDGVGIWPKNSGDIVVFKPAGGDIQHVGTITPDEWPTLLN